MVRVRGITVVGAVVCLVMKLLVWEPVDAYLIGAISASTLWASHSILTSVDGRAARRVGVLGEEWTVGELRKLRRRGWRFVNHVMLEYDDVDHAVLGPAGFFAVDSKCRSENATGGDDQSSSSYSTGSPVRSATTTSRIMTFQFISQNFSPRSSSSPHPRNVAATASSAGDNSLRLTSMPPR